MKWYERDKELGWEVIEGIAGERDRPRGKDG